MVKYIHLSFYTIIDCKRLNLSLKILNEDHCLRINAINMKKTNLMKKKSNRKITEMFLMPLVFYLYTLYRYYNALIKGKPQL
jgi:hypothetical protein